MVPVLSSGTMNMTTGLLFLFVMGASRGCDARELTTTGLSSREIVTPDFSVLQMSEGEVKNSDEVGRNGNMCTLCTEFATEALKFAQENKTQADIVNILHNTCSQLVPFEQQCITLVDYYVPQLFLEIGSVQPGEFCQKVNLCKNKLLTSRPVVPGDKCDICQYTVEEVLSELKDPDTQVEIIELLLKACDSLESYVKNCDTLVFEYAPLILTNAEQLLETIDICTAIYACDLLSDGSYQAPLMMF